MKYFTGKISNFSRTPNKNRTQLRIVFFTRLNAFGNFKADIFLWKCRFDSNSVLKIRYFNCYSIK